MSAGPNEIASYYFWRWAENELPGRPADVHAELVFGRKHQALQGFDPRPLLATLECASIDGQARGEQWDWAVVPDGESSQALSVFVTCPVINATERSVRSFQRLFSDLGLSGCEEGRLQIIPTFSPKINCLLRGQQPYQDVYDVDSEELGGLLRGIDAQSPNPYAILELAKPGSFVQCHAMGRRFVVEWAENECRGGVTIFNQWKAQDRKRLTALTEPYHQDLPDSVDPDLLRFSDTMRIFEVFMRGEHRPACYHWMTIGEQTG